jgi:FkbM family methyltransferase
MIDIINSGKIKRKMNDIKNPIRKIVNKFGIDIHKSSVKEKRITPARVVGELGYYETPIGNFYLPLDAPNDVIINHMKEGKIFEPEIMEVAERYIKEGTAVLDVGANFGQMSIIFSRLVGKKGEVYSFEAQKKVFDILEKNAEVNDAHNINSVFNAVYLESGTTFYFPEPDFEQFSAYGSYNLPLDAVLGQEVKSLKIDDLQIEKPISFMKIDVQGCDLFAMQGAIETIKSHKMPIIFEFEQQFQNVYKTNFQDYVNFVDSIGYKFAEIILDINYLIEPK